jgi:hypothetical protein
MEEDLKINKMEDDVKKKKKGRQPQKKYYFSIPLQFRPNPSWGWLSSLRFF